MKERDDSYFSQIKPEDEILFPHSEDEWVRLRGADILYFDPAESRARRTLRFLGRGAIVVVATAIAGLASYGLGALFALS